MIQKSQHQHFDLLIRPESGHQFMVSLWAVRGIGVSQPVLTSPPASWLSYARLLEDGKVLDSRSLGRVDASISRGESIVQPIHCSTEALQGVGLREELEVFRKGLALRALFRGEDRASQGSRMKLSANLPFHPRRCAARVNTLVSRPLVLPDTSAGRLPSPPAAEEIPVESICTHPGGSAGGASFALLGVRIDNLTMQETVDALDGLITKGGFHQVATANVDFLTRAFDDRELLHLLHGCELVLPDGMPVVWAAKMMGVPLKGRVTGADLLPRLFALSEQKQRRIFLLGATEERSNLAMERIRREFPKANICGRYSPAFAPIEKMDNDHILGLIQEARPDILLVAFGNPKQEKWLHRHRDCLNVPVCIGVGASIDFFSGMQSRAPLWMQKTGLEWIHRLASEPRRLAKRYAADAGFIAKHLSVQLLALALQRQEQNRSSILLKYEGEIPVLSIKGQFSAAIASQRIESLAAARLHHSLVIDLTESSCISADATGLLLHLAQRCVGQGTELWIAGLTGPLRSTLRATFPAGEPFHTAHTLQDALRFIRP